MPQNSITNPNSGLANMPNNYGYGAMPSAVEQDMKYTDVTKAKASDMKQEIGRSGVLIMSGFIIAEEYNADLQGRTSAKKYDEMRRSDATVWGVLKALKTPLLASHDYLEANQGDGVISKRQAEEVKAFVADQLFNKIDWESFKREAYTFLDFGYSVFEKTFNISNFNGKDRIGIEKIAFRKQYSIYRWNMGDGQPGVQQWLLTGGFKDIPDWKLCVFTNEKEGDNYMGISVLRPIYKNWYMKDVLVKIDAMAHERHGVGTPVVSPTGDGSVSPEEVKELREALRNQRSNEQAYIELPANTKLDAFPMNSGSPRDILGSIKYHNEQMFLSILGQFLMLGQSGGSGSRSLSEDTSSLFVHSLEFYANYFNRIVQNKVIRNLVDLNWGKDCPAPKLMHEKIGDDNVALFADAIQKLFSAGMVTPTVESERFVRDMLQMPALTKEQEDAWEKPAPAPTSAINTDTEKKAAEILRNAKQMSERITRIVG